MPKEVLHILYGYEEAKPIHYGEPLHIQTHGIENVVVQFEKKRYARQTSGVMVEPNGSKLLTHAPMARHKTARCRFCQKASVPQGVWKHEKYCEKNPKRTKRGGEQ